MNINKKIAKILYDNIYGVSDNNYKILNYVKKEGYDGDKDMLNIRIFYKNDNDSYVIESGLTKYDIMKNNIDDRLVISYINESIDCSTYNFMGKILYNWRTVDTIMLFLGISVILTGLIIIFKFMFLIPILGLSVIILILSTLWLLMG